jgi:amino acid adenylation domain-containing protein
LVKEGTELDSKIKLSELQLRMYLSEQAQIASSNFSLPMAYHFESLLDYDALIKSLQDFINHHVVLCSKIIEIKGEVFFDVQDNVTLDLTIEKTNLASAVKNYKQDAKLGFDLGHGPLFRFKIFEIENQYTVLYINFHHIIYDGHSSRIFMRELEKRYRSFKKNEKLDILANRISKRVSSVTPAFLEELKALYSFPRPILDIPKDFTGPAIELNAAGSCSFDFPLSHLEKAQSTCQQLGITLYHFYTYAFSILLSRYSGQKEFLIGTPVLGRNSKQELGDIGFYANTMLLPMSLDGEHTLAEGMQYNAKVIDKVLKYKKISYGELVESLGKTSLYQSFFMYQDFSSQKQRFNGINYIRTHLNSGMAHSEIDLWLTKYDGVIKGGLHYKQNKYSRATMERMQDSFLMIIDQLCESTESKLVELPKLCSTDQEILIKKFSNYNERKAPGFLKSFKEQVQKCPQNLAIINDGQQMSYLNLDTESDLFASYLLRCGIEPGDIIGVCLPRSTNILISFLAILKLDCCFLPIDPSFPSDRVKYMAQHCDLKYIINEKETNHSFDSISNIEFNSFLKNRQNISKLQYQFKQLDFSTAYILYTSGSTGKPKGVEISVLSMNNFLDSMLENPGIKSCDTVMAITTISFDISILEFFLPLMAGAKLYIASSEEVRSGHILAKLISKYKISFMQATPVTWRLLFEAGWGGSKGFKALCGGEKLSVDLAIKLTDHCSEVWNMYGPTETTVWSTINKITKDKLDYISIGAPIDNTSVYLLDQDMNMVPNGAIGEIYIGGAGVAKGYFNSPELTKKHFLNDPFRENETQEMYCTGDLGRIIDDDLICLGRVDQQVKLNGYRIELEEINLALNKLKGIRNSFTLVREGSNHQPKLVAYIILDGVGPLKSEEYYKYLKEVLPFYMIPNQYISMESFPLTANGKIDQNKFPIHLGQGASSGHDPRSMTEIKLALIWQAHIGLEHVYLDDDFFQIGGNSLMATAIFSAISVEFNLNMELSSLLHNKTLRELATRIDTLLRAGGVSQAFSNLVKLQDGGEKDSKDYFFFHAIGGNTLNYRVFLKALSGFNIYGLQCTGVDGKSIKFRSVSEMATIYIGEILKLENKGPYNLAGGSFGGYLVHEVARQLIARGYQVGTLTMFDTSSPNSERQRSIGGLRINFLSIVNLIYQVLNISTPHSIRYKLIEYLNMKAAKGFRAKPIDAGLLLLRMPLKATGIYAKGDLGWSEYIKGQIEVKYIEASHNEFIESKKVVSEFIKSLG